MPQRRATAVDRAARLALRLAYRGAKLWWRLRRPALQSTGVAVWHGGRVLLVRHSYKPGYSLPGGGLGRSEKPAVGAARELREEVGIAADAAKLIPAGLYTRSGRFGTVTSHLFEYRPDHEPEIDIDRREIVEARLVPGWEARRIAVDRNVRRYIERILAANNG